MIAKSLGINGAVHQLHRHSNYDGDGNDAVMSSHAIACSNNIGPVIVRNQQAMNTQVSVTTDTLESERASGIYDIDTDPNDNGGRATMTLNLGSTTPSAEESIEIVETNCIYADNNYGQVQ